jgi:uncharacterized membrane protein
VVNAFINPQIFTVVGIIAIILTTVAILVAKRLYKPRQFSRRTQAVFGLLILAAGWLGSAGAFNVQQGIMNGARTSSVQEAYGITLTAQNLADLRIPRGAPPAPEDGKVLTLFVSWDGEGFELRDADGKPLPRN